MNRGYVKCWGQQGIQQPFAAEPILPDPGEELRCCRGIRKDLHRLRSVPYQLRTFKSRRHVQWIGTSTIVCDDMDEFGKDLRCEGKLVTGPAKLVEQSSRVRVTRMRC